MYYDIVYNYIYRASDEIAKLGGNKELERLIEKLSQLYKTTPSPAIEGTTPKLTVAVK